MKLKRCGVNTYSFYELKNIFRFYGYFSTGEYKTYENSYSNLGFFLIGNNKTFYI